MKKLFNFILAAVILASAIPAFAGKGFFITINNQSESNIFTSVTDVNCMYNIDNLVMTLPKNSKSSARYVEQKEGGACHFQKYNPGHYILHIAKANGESADISYTYNNKTGICNNNYCFAISNYDVVPTIQLNDGKQMSVNIIVK